MLWEIGAVWREESIRRISPPPPHFFGQGELISTKSPANFLSLLPCVPDMLNSAGRFMKVIHRIVFLLEQHRAEWTQDQVLLRNVQEERGDT